MSEQPASAAQQLTSLLTKTRSLFEKHNRPDLVTGIDQQLPRLLRKERTVMVCGEFKRGKSSLVNALLDNSGLCPVDIDIATDVVSLIRYGEQARVIRRFGKIGGEEFEEIPLEKLNEYATGKSVDPSEDNSTWMLEIEWPNARLQEGLVILDTPGVGGLEAKHAYLTEFFLPMVDVALFVSDVSEPLSQRELDFLKNKACAKARTLAVVVNKTDTVDDASEYIDDIRCKLQEVLDEPYRDVAIVAVSSKLKLDYLASQDEDDWEECNFSELEKVLDHAVVQQYQTLLMSVISDVVQSLEDVKAPLEVQKQALESSNNDELEVMRARFSEQKQRMQTLAAPNAEWRKKLNKQFSRLRAEIDFFVQDKNEDLRRWVAPKNLEDLEVSDDIADYFTHLQSRLDSISQEVKEYLENGVSEIIKVVESELAVSMNDEVLLSQYEHDVNASSDNLKVPGINEKIFTYGRSLFLNSPMAVVVGGVAGSVLMPIVGIGAGAYIYYQAINANHTQLKDVTFRAVSNELMHEVQTAMLAMRKYLFTSFDEIEENINQIIANELERSQIKFNEITEALKAMSLQSEQERIEHQKLVKTKIEPINQQLRYYARMHQNLEKNV